MLRAGAVISWPDGAAGGVGRPGGLDLALKRDCVNVYSEDALDTPNWSGESKRLSLVRRALIKARNESKQFTRLDADFDEDSMLSLNFLDSASRTDVTP